MEKKRERKASLERRKQEQKRKENVKLIDEARKSFKKITRKRKEDRRGKIES